VIENIPYIIQQLYFRSYKYITLYSSVVDIYQEWAGPCRSVEGNFKRIKYELEDPLLKFALVIIVSYRIYIHKLSSYLHSNTHRYIYIYIYPIYYYIHSISTHYLHFYFVLVVDVYQTYGGPCKALEAKFRAIKNTLGDPLLAFAIVSQYKPARFSFFLIKKQSHNTNEHVCKNLNSFRFSLG
jgi:hypothetical protein